MPPAAAYGIVVLRRRWIVRWPLLVPAGVLTIVARVAYGLVLFCAPFEVCLVVLVAAAPDSLSAQWRIRVRARRVERTGSSNAKITRGRDG
jgi:hypothetical protein